MKYLFLIPILFICPFVYCSTNDCFIRLCPDLAHLYAPTDMGGEGRRQPAFGIGRGFGFLWIYRADLRNLDGTRSFDPQEGDIFLEVDGCDLTGQQPEGSYNRLEIAALNPGRLEIGTVLFVRNGSWYQSRNGATKRIPPQSADPFYRPGRPPAWLIGYWRSEDAKLSVVQHGSYLLIQGARKDESPILEVVAIECQAGGRCQGLEFSKGVTVTFLDDRSSRGFILKAEPGTVWQRYNGHYKKGY